MCALIEILLFRKLFIVMCDILTSYIQGLAEVGVQLSVHETEFILVSLCTNYCII